jgi:hypothetical protein
MDLNREYNELKLIETHINSLNYTIPNNPTITFKCEDINQGFNLVSYGTKLLPYQSINPNKTYDCKDKINNKTFNYNIKFNYIEYNIQSGCSYKCTLNNFDYNNFNCSTRSYIKLFLPSNKEINKRFNLNIGNIETKHIDYIFNNTSVYGQKRINITINDEEIDIFLIGDEYVCIESKNIEYNKFYNCLNSINIFLEYIIGVHIFQDGFFVQIDNNDIRIKYSTLEQNNFNKLIPFETVQYLCQNHWNTFSYFYEINKTPFMLSKMNEYDIDENKNTLSILSINKLCNIIYNDNDKDLSFINLINNIIGYLRINDFNNSIKQITYITESPILRKDKILPTWCMWIIKLFYIIFYYITLNSKKFKEVKTNLFFNIDETNNLYSNNNLIINQPIYRNSNLNDFEINFLKKCRNYFAHPRIKDKKELYKFLKKKCVSINKDDMNEYIYFKFYTIINKVVLSYIGYKGNIINHTSKFNEVKYFSL